MQVESGKATENVTEKLKVLISNNDLSRRIQTIEFKEGKEIKGKVQKRETYISIHCNKIKGKEDFCSYPGKETKDQPSAGAQAQCAQ